MQSVKILAGLLVLGTLAAISVPAAKADESDWDTRITFSAPVEVPGMALAPGTYEFRKMDITSSGYIIAILNSDGHYLEIIPAETAYRTQSTDKTAVKFEKRNPKWPEAIKSWFYPDENYGVRFTYPRENRSTN